MTYSAKEDQAGVCRAAQILAWGAGGNPLARYYVGAMSLRSFPFLV
jgi:hypothetical protein